MNALSLTRPVPLFKHFCPLCPLRLLHRGHYLAVLASAHQVLRRVRLSTRRSAASHRAIQTVRSRSATSRGSRILSTTPEESAWGSQAEETSTPWVTFTESQGDLYRTEG